MREWEYYLARPFDLFGATLWESWYSGFRIRELLGFGMNDCLIIEHPRGTANHFRSKIELEGYFKAFDNLMEKEPGKCLELLRKARFLNKYALEVLRTQKISIEAAIELFTDLGIIATVLPHRLGERGYLVRQAKKLREISLYPEVYTNVIAPKIREETGDILDKVSYSEYKSGQIKRRSRGSFYLFERCGTKESVRWVDDPLPLINGIQGISRECRGQVAQRGYAKGIALIVLSNNSSKFKEGDILIAVSTSPLLYPIMKKASAIVTDEGGVMSHAAILSRELKKPCIIGTKNATKVLKDGDLVEVDADKGVVRKL